MEDKIAYFCTSCETNAFFRYDGEDWICQNCGSVNSRGDADALEDEDFVDNEPDHDED